MADKRTSPPARGSGARAERLAAALRANLRRRKQQARGRSSVKACDRAAAERKPAVE